MEIIFIFIGAAILLGVITGVYFIVTGGFFTQDREEKIKKIKRGVACIIIPILLSFIMGFVSTFYNNDQNVRKDGNVVATIAVLTANTLSLHAEGKPAPTSITQVPDYQGYESFINRLQVTYILDKDTKGQVNTFFSFCAPYNSLTLLDTQKTDGWSLSNGSICKTTSFK